MADPPPSASPSDLDQARRTSMAAERTWLAWWRTALAASAGALAVGRLAPEVLDVAPGPYIALGCGYAALPSGSCSPAPSAIAISSARCAAVSTSRSRSRPCWPSPQAASCSRS